MKGGKKAAYTARLLTLGLAYLVFTGRRVNCNSVIGMINSETAGLAR